MLAFLEFLYIGNVCFVGRMYEIPAASVRLWPLCTLTMYVLWKIEASSLLAESLSLGYCGEKKAFLQKDEIR
jgi:hypothetical protein